MDEDEARLFSRVVHIAEKVGKPASLVAVAGEDPCSLILQAAQKLHSSRVVIGRSSRQANQEPEIERAWEQLPNPRPTVLVEIVSDNGEKQIQINLGAI